MPSLTCLLVILSLSAISGAQEVKVNPVANKTEVPAGGPEVGAKEDPKSAPSLAQDQPLPVKSEAPASPVVTSDLSTNVTQEVLHPQVAFRLAEGSPGLSKQLLAESNGTTKILGFKCTTDQDCFPLNNTKCREGMCLCSTGYTPSKHKLDVCLKVPKAIGDPCEEEVQCETVVIDSECRDSKCVCPTNYIQNGSRCWEKQKLGGKCNISQQCEDVTFAVCAQGVCTCESPLIPSPINKCLAPAGNQYNAQCVEDIQCSYSYGDEARCSSGQCVCNSNHHYNGTRCVIDKKLGEACLVDGDCTVSNTNNVQDSRMCLRNACVCATGFSALPGEDTCKSSGEELAVSLTWVLCIVLAKYYLA